MDNPEQKPERKSLGVIWAMKIKKILRVTTSKEQ